jgi:hypothetical protein
METTTVYFEEKGKGNTATVLALAGRRAKELGISTMVVATTWGGTAAAAVTQFPAYHIVAVTHVDGYQEPNAQQLTAENRATVTAAGGDIVTAGHAFAGVGRAIRKRYQGIIPDDLIADALKMFGQGMKVCCEVALMAADAGHIKVDAEVIAIGGSSGGADTAVVLTPAYSASMFDLKIREIICKPRDF